MADSEHELWYETVSEEQINKNIDYLNNKLNETGKPVPENFEYRSDNNIHFLTVQEIIKINKGLLL